MQGYNPGLHGQYHAVAQPSGTLHDHGSPSGSDDDAGYLAYPEPHKMEPGVDDDSNAALTSQTLNADGTPKRPMNAFMIFARRRRPQVSAENQSMRTGEVSKILSREWNGMSLSDKQFYLDQAKILKDNFNQKYPDYVYKRRPNNTRKRRKADPTPSLSADQASTSDVVDDYSGSTEYSDVSPVDVADTDDPRLSGQDIRYASLPAEASDETYSSTPSRASSYQPSDTPYRPLGDTRVSYVSRPGRATPDTAMTPSISSVSRGSDTHGANYYHPYMTAQQQYHAQSSPYFADSSSAGEVWSSTRVDQSRVQVQPWSQNSQDLGVDDRHRGYPQPGSSHAWANTGAPEGIPSSSSSGAPSANYNFPTLNSPFYPPQSGAQEAFPSSSVQPISVPPQHYGPIAPIPGNPVSGRLYPPLQQAYSSSSPSTMGSYQQQARTVSHTVTPGQAMSSYPQTQSTSTPPPAGSGGGSSQMRYWQRER
ncbi:hypothetical protein OG21DRAFT_1489758 [Imleria badia]|nr:hypothetical protein OG21DRAFT_1489758 [Imleria badia]